MESVHAAHGCCGGEAGAHKVAASHCCCSGPSRHFITKEERRESLEQYKDQLKKETQAFEALHPSADLVGLEQAFSRATEEWRPGEDDTTPVEKDD